MKTALILTLFLISFYAFSQSKVDKLQDRKKNLNIRLNILRDSLDIIDKEIKTALISELDAMDHVFTNITSSHTYMYSDLNLINRLKLIPDSSIVKVIDIIDGNPSYLKVQFGSTIGYLLAINVKKSDELNNFTESKRLVFLKQKEGKDSINYLEGLKRQNEIENKWKLDYEIQKQKLIKKFGLTATNRILDKEIWIGMTSDMAIESCGNPQNNNRSVGSWGVHEQWVYTSRYLYFENGILTSWQDSN